MACLQGFARGHKEGRASLLPEREFIPARKSRVLDFPYIKMPRQRFRGRLGSQGGTLAFLVALGDCAQRDGFEDDDGVHVINRNDL